MCMLDIECLNQIMVFNPRSAVCLDLMSSIAISFTPLTIWIIVSSFIHSIVLPSLILTGFGTKCWVILLAAPWGYPQQRSDYAYELENVLDESNNNKK